MSLEVRRPGPTVRHRVVEVNGPDVTRRRDTLVTEEPLEIRAEWPGQPPRRISVTMRTPGHDFELSAGYLAGEGVLDGVDLVSVTYCTDVTLRLEEQYNVVTATLAGPPARLPERAATMTAACGVCGTASLDDVYSPDLPPLTPTSTLRTSTVLAMPELLRDRQSIFGTTGGLHAAGVFTADGDRLIVREDVGRHNAVDKVVGARRLGEVTFGSEHVLCVSGRLGFDIVAKVAAARIGAVVAVGAPTSLAVRLAEQAGVTLVGFTRGERLVAYTHTDRIEVG